MPKKIDYTGRKIGKLTLINIVGKNHHNAYLWEFKCDCGEVGIISSQLLNISTHHHSCGCNSKKGNNFRVQNHTLLKAHGSMLKRCYDKDDPNYHNYGGRGIMVCERWHDYDSFYDDVIGSWKKGLQLDRTNNDGNYEPSNFRWVTPVQNSRNSRATKLNEEKVLFIRRSKLSNKELGGMFNIHPDTARQIRKYAKSWKEIIS
jgi:hypothetical protein